MLLEGTLASNSIFMLTTPSCFVHMSYKNVASAFDKLTSCLQDVQEWMLSSRLKGHRKHFSQKL